MEIYCVYPNGDTLSKVDIEQLKRFKKIIINYLKIKRLHESINPLIGRGY